MSAAAGSSGRAPPASRSDEVQAQSGGIARDPRPAADVPRQGRAADYAHRDRTDADEAAHLAGARFSKSAAQSLSRWERGRRCVLSKIGVRSAIW